MHNATILASENERLVATNHQQIQKRAKQRSYVASGGILTVEEGARRAKIRNQGVNEDIEANSSEGKKRAPNRCSMCKSYDHTARTCQQY
jgi:hypothetical protein